MKKIVIILIIVVLILSGCKYQREIYNDKDKTDFSDGCSVKFDIIQLKNVIDKNTLKESKLDGGFFLFMGSISGTTTEKTILTNYYYGYLKNKNGAIYFAQIPASKVKIYEDAETPCIVAYTTNYTSSNSKYDYCVDVNKENDWNNYKNFNLHIPKGTIIPRINLNFDISKLK